MTYSTNLTSTHSIVLDSTLRSSNLVENDKRNSEREFNQMYEIFCEDFDLFSVFCMPIVLCYSEHQILVRMKNIKIFIFSFNLFDPNF